MKDEELRQSAEILKREFWARGQESEITALENLGTESGSWIELLILVEAMNQGEVVLSRAGRHPERVKLEDAVDKITEIISHEIQSG